ncbi:MAG TPA: hypothetical protein VNM40_04120 [Candidatus Paceibacterota bacterium]|nr:hypothetical protein [Candidatus Paceibacterota bacterium]
MPHAALYIAGAIAALVLVSTAAFTMLRTGTSGGFDTWQSPGGFFSTGEPIAAQPQEQDTYRGDGVESLGLIPLPPTSTDEPQTFVSDLAELLTQLTQPQQTTRAAEEDFVPSSYSFIPQGLVSVETPRPRSAADQALFEYGNSLGSTLQAFADLHQNMPQILKDQAEDRTNSMKVAALKRLADDFSRLGDTIAAMDGIPSEAIGAHQALAAAYRDVGAQLAKVPDAQGDDAFLAAINTYNGSAENLSRRLVEIADIFGSRNVGFTTSDPGSIFIFSGNTSF